MENGFGKAFETRPESCAGSDYRIDLIDFFFGQLRDFVNSLTGSISPITNICGGSRSRSGCRISRTRISRRGVGHFRAVLHPHTSSGSQQCCSHFDQRIAVRYGIESRTLDEDGVKLQKKKEHAAQADQEISDHTSRIIVAIGGRQLVREEPLEKLESHHYPRVPIIVNKKKKSSHDGRKRTRPHQDGVYGLAMKL